MLIVEIVKIWLDTEVRIIKKYNDDDDEIMIVDDNAVKNDEMEMVQNFTQN